MDKSISISPAGYPLLTSEVYLRELLEKHGVRPRRAAGQHFLVCERVTAATLTALSNGPPRISELGAGCGTLTGPLLAHHYTVRAIESDQQIAAVLLELTPKAARDRLELIVGDLREQQWEWAEPWQLVGNIPYQLSGFIIRRLTQLKPPPALAVLLLQREVGARVTANEPQLQLLGLAVQLWGSARALLTVPASCFWPAPQVDSQLVALAPHTPPDLSLAERELVLQVAAHFFRNRRKQMGGVLRRQRGISDLAAERLLHTAGITPNQRPQEVAPAQWVRLAATLRT